MFENQVHAGQLVGPEEWEKSVGFEFGIRTRIPVAKNRCVPEVKLISNGQAARCTPDSLSGIEGVRKVVGLALGQEPRILLYITILYLRRS